MGDTDRIRNKISQLLEQPLEALVDDAELIALVSNSFLLVEMLIEMQEEFDVRFNQADMEGVTNVGQLIAVFDERMTGEA